MAPAACDQGKGTPPPDLQLQVLQFVVPAIGLRAIFLSARQRTIVLIPATPTAHQALKRR
jgi:hypothetical protein